MAEENPAPINADTALELENRKLKMEGDFTTDKPLYVKSAKIVEGLCKLTETKLEFITTDKTLELTPVVGPRITLLVEAPEGAQDSTDRTFTGRCISAEYIGLSQGMGHFIAHIRPFFWFLTRGM